MDVGGRFAGICARVNDNRSKRIDIIRKTLETPAPPLTTEQLVKVQMAKDKHEKGANRRTRAKMQKPEEHSKTEETGTRSVAGIQANHNSIHSLKSISNEVVRRYIDKPLQLNKHLPFISHTAPAKEASRADDPSRSASASRSELLMVRSTEAAAAATSAIKRQQSYPVYQESDIAGLIISGTAAR